MRTYLIKKGIDPARMIAGGYGPTVPIADNKTKAGREANRRVEFHIVEEPKPEKKPAGGDDSGGDERARAEEQRRQQGRMSMRAVAIGPRSRRSAAGVVGRATRRRTRSSRACSSWSTRRAR